MTRASDRMLREVVYTVDAVSENKVAASRQPDECQSLMSSRYTQVVCVVGSSPPKQPEFMSAWRGFELGADWPLDVSIRKPASAEPLSACPQSFRACGEHHREDAVI